LAGDAVSVAARGVRAAVYDVGSTDIGVGARVNRPSDEVNLGS
jgi:hypothetical protein